MKNSLRRTIGRVPVAAALAALLPLAFASPVHAAADTLDQSLVLQFWPGSQSSVHWFAQTFTPGTTGQVDRVSLPAYTPGGFARFTVSIGAVGANGMPSGTLLGSSPTISGAVTCCQFHDYGFTPMVSLTKGTVYAIVVQVVAGGLAWPDSGPVDAYAGGRELIGSNASTWFTTTHGDFGFKEWVSSYVNSAPNVAANSSALTVTEGSAPSNGGPCSDTDGDSVTLSASAGAVSACANGTWSWTEPAQDEGPVQTVSITADDGHGLTSTTSFTVAVTAVGPTARFVSDPITVPEGTVVPFTGGATSPDAADNAAGFTYQWTVSNNNATYATGTGAAFSFTPQDDGSYEVTLKATDDGGMSGSISTTVVATNVAPSVAINSVTPTVPLVTTADETLSFSGGFTDVDTNDAYTITWTFGDGGSAAGKQATHAYSAPGTYTVTFRVSDGEGGVGQATTTVTIQSTQQAIASIEAYVQGLPGLNAGQRNSLLAKLSAASDSAARGNTTAASNQLNAFLNELQADVSTGKVSAASAATLRSAVRAVQGGIGTFNRFVEFWPLQA